MDIALLRLVVNTDEMIMLTSHEMLGVAMVTDDEIPGGVSAVIADEPSVVDKSVEVPENGALERHLRMPRYRPTRRNKWSMFRAGYPYPVDPASRRAAAGQNVVASLCHSKQPLVEGVAVCMLVT